MSPKPPKGVLRVVRVPSPAGQQLPPGGFHAVHVVHYDARIKSGTPEFAAIEQFVSDLTRTVGQTECVRLRADLP